MTHEQERMSQMPFPGGFDARLCHQDRSARADLHAPVQQHAAAPGLATAGLEDVVQWAQLTLELPRDLPKDSHRLR